MNTPKPTLIQPEKFNCINNFNIDHCIDLELQEAIIKLTRLTIYSNPNSHNKELLSITEKLQKIKSYCETPSLNYLSIKEKIQNDYYSDLGLEGTIIKCSFIPNACHSKMGYFPLNFENNG